MNRSAMTLALLAGLALPAAADDEKQSQKPSARPAEGRTTPEQPPEEFKGFDGLLVGRLVTKDIEKGTVVVTIDAVSCLCPRNKAENQKPKSAIGKTLAMDGLFGSNLDRLLVMKPGDTFYFLARYDGGSRLNFGGEVIWKAEWGRPGDYPELPEEFRGFQGIVVGTIVVKKLQTPELILRIDEVKETSQKSRARKPASIVGKDVLLGGFWQHRNDYQGLKAGDRIECSVQHPQTLTDLLDVSKFVRKGGDENNPQKAP